MTRIAAAGGIEIEARILAQHVVAGIVDAAERQRRAQVIAFGGVIVDDVEDHLDAGRVQLLHHAAKFGGGRGAGGVALRGGEEADGVVAPIVPEALLDQIPVVEELLHRQQLDGGHAELDEVLDGAGVSEACERAAIAFGYIRMARRHALDVRLVDDRLGPVRARPLVALACQRRVPTRACLERHAFRHEGRRVALVDGEVVVGSAQLIAKVSVVPADLALEGAGVGIDQQLVRS